MIFPEPSVRHRLALKLLKARLLSTSLVERSWAKIQKYRDRVIAGLIAGIALLIFVQNFHAIWGLVVALSKRTVDFSNDHPRFQRALHTAINSMPDVTVFLLTIAGLVYLMPNLVKKIESSKTLRRGLTSAIVMFCLLATIVNAINRETQDRKDDEHTKVERENSERVFQVQQSLGNLQTSLVQSKGSVSEIERRRHILQTLRDEYVLSHKGAPVSMIVGNQDPPHEWMRARLKQLGESWPYIPPPEQTSQVKPDSPPIPPFVDIATDNDQATAVQFNNNPGDLWFEMARKCLTPFKCYLDSDLATQHVQLHVGPKGWARIFLIIYNTGGSALNNPHVSVNLANGHGVSINRSGDHHPLGSNNSILQEFRPPVEIATILPYKITHNGYDYICDLVVDRTIGHFALGVRIFGDNMEARQFLVIFDVISEDSD